LKPPRLQAPGRVETDVGIREQTFGAREQDLLRGLPLTRKQGGAVQLLRQVLDKPVAG
jgi:hypothetical protein